MQQLKLWLIEKSRTQTYVIVTVIVLTIACNYLINRHIRRTQDFYTPFIYFILILWVYYSLFYTVKVGGDINEKIILKRQFDQPQALLGKFLKLSILIFFGYRTFFIFGRTGVLISLSLITVTGLFCIYVIARNAWKEKSTHKGFTETFERFAIIAGIVGYIYFILWKNSFCHEFGIKEIGNYFEKDTYEAKYIIEISRIGGDKTYKLPADLLISNDFSTYEDYDTETGIGAYSYGSTQTSETRFAKIKKVYFKNGGSLYFNECLVSIDNSYDDTCVDQNGEEWQIEITKEKAK
ncbi:hypothetical protein [Agriterribacter humi]|uniref:hypothetical protein n=1 Tax=Agriterribacter humi TaxID=1104781 RepID=UPI0012650CDE|nr:hypothetical protein [Agriterribacter humi]